MKTSALFARHDLRWFFAEAEGDLGLRGIDYDRSGGEVDPHEIAARRIEDVARWTNVATRLRAIGTTHERVLRVAFTPHRWPGLERWYELAGVAALIVDGEDLLGGARAIVGMTPEKADPLRAGAAGKLRIALSYYLSGKTVAPRPSRQVADLPPVRDKKRTWAPTSQGRGVWMSPGERMRPCDEVIGPECERVLRPVLPSAVQHAEREAFYAALMAGPLVLVEADGWEAFWLEVVTMEKCA